MKKILIHILIIASAVYISFVFYKIIAIYSQIDTIKKTTRHFAKRQITWLKRYDDMKWFDLSESKDDKDSIREIITWLEKNL